MFGGGVSAPSVPNTTVGLASQMTAPPAEMNGSAGLGAPVATPDVEPSPTLPEMSVAEAAAAAAFWGAPKATALGGDRWLVDGPAQGELPPLSESTTKDGLYTIELEKDSAGSLGLNVSELQQHCVVIVTGFKSDFMSRRQAAGKMATIQPDDAITHVDGACVLGLGFHAVVRMLRSTAALCTITLARGPTTMRAVGVIACRHRESENIVHRRPPLDGLGLPKVVGVREADDMLLSMQTVSPTASPRKFVAQVMYKGKVAIVGPYHFASDAAGAYDDILLRLCGLSAGHFTNFGAHITVPGDTRGSLESIRITRAFTVNCVPKMCDAAGAEQHSLEVLLPTLATGKVPYVGVRRHLGGFRAELHAPDGRHVVGSADLPIEAAVMYDAAVRLRPDLGLRPNFATPIPEVYAEAVRTKEALYNSIDATMSQQAKSRRLPSRKSANSKLFGSTVTRAHRQWIRLQIIAFHQLAQNGGETCGRAALQAALSGESNDKEAKVAQWNQPRARRGRKNMMNNKFRRRKSGGRSGRRGKLVVSREDETSSEGEAFQAKRSTNAGPTRRSNRATSKKSYTFDVDLTDSEEEAERTRTAAEVKENAPAIKVERILGVRYAKSIGTEAYPPTGDSDTDPDDKEKWGLDDDPIKRRERHIMRRRLKKPVQARRSMHNLEYMVKYHEVSYLHVEWVTHAFLKEYKQFGVGRMKKFLQLPLAKDLLDMEESRVLRGQPPLSVEEYFDPNFVTIDRIIAFKEEVFEEYVPLMPGEKFNPDDDLLPDKPGMNAGGGPGTFPADPTTKRLKPPALAGIRFRRSKLRDTHRKMYLVKWEQLGYGMATWEWAEEIDDPEKVASFTRFQRLPASSGPAFGARPPADSWMRYAESPKFKGGRTLRSYQLEGLNWLVYSWYQHRSVILADEMGLGKTVQTVSTLDHIWRREKCRGPFLVVAPLSTLNHWKREFEDWTKYGVVSRALRLPLTPSLSMSVVLYHDPETGAAGRELCRKHEFYFDDQRTGRNKMLKFNVLITSYQLILKDWDELKNIQWRYVVVDEAHSLKNSDSQLATCMKSLTFDAVLLLTGTPLQNDVQELWSLLNVINPTQFNSIEMFLGKYHGLTTPEDVARLQEDLRPYMLRRVKEDVEKSIPAKEETVIDVELTNLQKQYYRAIFDRNRNLLSRGAASMGLQNLNNIEMQLRKCCNHPFLLTGAEDRQTKGLKTLADVVETTVKASGKMVLLDKLLPKLKAEKHRVLIFSQFTTMLDLLEDLMRYRGHKHLRIDGSVRGSVRQSSIDKFNAPGSEYFVFLLTTRAGGVGINLTTADTVIIYDSDWNPQNDLQATARCHRIGQTSTVSIYRLITKRTYEAQMFRRASRKLGLSQAVFETGGIRSGFDEDDEVDGGLVNLMKADTDKVEMLLRFGAYALFDEDDDGKDADAFSSKDIDSILATSATTIKYNPPKRGDDVDGGAGAGTTQDMSQSLNFAKATFAAEGSDAALDLKDPSFWDKVLGPKVSDRLLTDLTENVLLEADAATRAKFLGDVHDLVKEVLQLRSEGEVHADMETIMSILIELQVRGRKWDLPLPADDPIVAAVLSKGTRTPATLTTMAHLAQEWVDDLETRRRQRKAITRYSETKVVDPFEVELEPVKQPKKRAPARAKRSTPSKSNLFVRLRDLTFGTRQQFRVMFTYDSAKMVAVTRKRSAAPPLPDWVVHKLPEPQGAGAGDVAYYDAPAPKRVRIAPLPEYAPDEYGQGDYYYDDDDPGFEEEEDETACCICGSSHGSDDDPIVECEMCGIFVHKLCYGVTDDLEDSWYCGPCSAGEGTPLCPLCPTTGGAFKRVQEGGWGHVLCALWSGCRFGSVETMEPIVGVMDVADGFTHDCVLCKSGAGMGFTVKCFKSGCNEWFHPICGRTHQHTMVLVQRKLQAACATHALDLQDLVEAELTAVP